MDFSKTTDKGVLSVFIDNAFIGAIESTTASCDITDKFISEIQSLQSQIIKLKADLGEALELLSCASPNPMCIEDEEYWQRFEELNETKKI